MLQFYYYQFINRFHFSINLWLETKINAMLTFIIIVFDKTATK